MASDNKLPPFPDRSVAVLKTLMTGVKRRRPEPATPTAGFPTEIIIDVSTAVRKPRWHVGHLLLTQDGIPVYRLHGEYSTLDAAVEEIRGPVSDEIELED